MSQTYVVTTDNYGVIKLEADSIAHARRWAREAFGVRNPRLVRREDAYVMCDGCNSKPCCCSNR